MPSGWMTWVITRGQSVVVKCVPIHKTTETRCAGCGTRVAQVFSCPPPDFPRTEQPEGNLAAWHVHHKFIMRGVKQTICAFMQRSQQLPHWPPPPAVGEGNPLVLTKTEIATTLVGLTVSKWESLCLIWMFYTLFVVCSSCLPDLDETRLSGVSSETLWSFSISLYFWFHK